MYLTRFSLALTSEEDFVIVGSLAIPEVSQHDVAGTDVAQPWTSVHVGNESSLDGTPGRLRRSEASKGALCRPSLSEAPVPNGLHGSALTPGEERWLLSRVAAAWTETVKPSQALRRTSPRPAPSRPAIKSQRPAPAPSRPHHSTRLSLMRCAKRCCRPTEMAASHGAWRSGGPNRQTCTATQHVAGNGAQPPKVWQVPNAVISSSPSTRRTSGPTPLIDAVRYNDFAKFLFSGTSLAHCVLL